MTADELPANKKEANKERFEHYAKVAKTNIDKMNFDTFKSCKTENDFKNYMLNVYIAFYGLRCECNDGMDWEFNSASGHYHDCNLWRFCHIINRCLEWNKLTREK